MLIQKPISRLVVVAVIAALAAMFIPAHAAARTVPAKCCPHSQAAAEKVGGCAAHHQTPKKPSSDPSCCQACAICLTLLFVPPAPFVYPQTGEESLVSPMTRSHSLPHRPPVPPPRSAFV